MNRKELEEAIRIADERKASRAYTKQLRREAAADRGFYFSSARNHGKDRKRTPEQIIQSKRDITKNLLNKWNKHKAQAKTSTQKSICRYMVETITEIGIF